jgi:16S rRNA (cytosine967-C5)-methyltransferase
VTGARRAGQTDDRDGHRDRLVAARGLTAVLRRGRTLDQYEQSLPEPGLSPLGRALLYGTCRHYGALLATANTLLDKPLRGKDQDVLSLLVVGIYQLLALSTPDHAAVAATVTAARKLKQPWAGGLINACLRRLLKQRATLPADKEANDPDAPAIATHPADLPAALRAQLAAHYPADAEAISQALSRRAPMSLRVNRRQLSVDAYLEQLNAAGLASREAPAGAGRTLDQAIPSTGLPGFDAGLVAVQDAGAMLVADLVEQLRPGFSESPRRFLDACSAPGGKLFALLEAPGLQGGLDASGASALALERSEPRFAALRKEAERLGHAEHPNLRLAVGDASDRAWWDGEPWDLILIDAPCSGCGTLRRHPDIKWLRNFDDLGDDTALQDAILANLAPLLAPGGLLLYVTCSLLPAENDGRVEQLLTREPGLAAVPLALPTGRSTRHGWQLLPTDPQTDGFYYAAIEHLQ